VGKWQSFPAAGHAKAWKRVADSGRAVLRPCFASIKRIFAFSESIEAKPCFFFFLPQTAHQLQPLNFLSSLFIFASANFAASSSIGIYDDFTAAVTLLS
jgi:hypothetical protein